MNLKHNLYRQLLAIVAVVFTIIYISVAIVLPKSLVPIYEKAIFSYLKNPLDVVRNDFNNQKIDSLVAYIYVNNDNIYTSGNIDSVIDLDTKQILNKVIYNQGKFKFKNKFYYYNTKQEDNGYKIIAITDDTYLKELKGDLLKTLFPILIVTLLLIISIIAWWSRSLADKILILKEKVDNLDNDNYREKHYFKVDDELKVLSNAIDDMKITLQKGEEYKNQMYQNISHDFKTPLTVIKSYVEAIEDGIEEKDKGLEIIKQEVNKLEIKVHSLLYLNKLTYYKDMDDFKNGKVNIVDILQESVKKFKITRPDIKWKIDILDKKTAFIGNHDLWEAIVDNILSNFIRYAENEIKITVKNYHIIFYNDGPSIDKNIINNVFTPYTKGINGKTGLGLSIVQRTLSFLGLNVIVKNEKKGVSFIIK